jgi:hypothetical protein
VCSLAEGCPTSFPGSLGLRRSPACAPSLAPPPARLDLEGDAPPRPHPAQDLLKRKARVAQLQKEQQQQQQQQQSGSPQQQSGSPEQQSDSLEQPCSGASRAHNSSSQDGEEGAAGTSSSGGGSGGGRGRRGRDREVLPDDHPYATVAIWQLAPQPLFFEGPRASAKALAKAVAEDAGAAAAGGGGGSRRSR